MFEKEFINDIKPPKNYYLMLKRAKGDIEYEIKSEYFYGIQPPISYEKVNNQLNVTVKKHTIKTLYLTYLTLDTKFKNVPQETFVDLENSRKFYINIDVTANSSVEVIPFIIQYDTFGKKNMKRITRPMEYFEADDDVIKLRLVFKIKGHGNFIIRSIKRRDVN
ncbi:hypothetical protein LNK15_00400 [Jeotgalicoccus huakuii]|nr:hypothetical protein [Jeotgalicoccus huakuii]